MTKLLSIAVVAAIVVANPLAHGLTIYDVQSSDASTAWQSPYFDGASPQYVDVTGGVITYASNPPGKAFARLVIQDPTYSEWAGIEIKIFDTTSAGEFAVGDRVDFTNVRVDENRGTTYLLYDSRASSEGGYESGYQVLSQGNTVDPLVLAPSVLGYNDPIQTLADEEAANSSADYAVAEKYEGMLVKILNPTVNTGSFGYGSHSDNYELITPEGVCWASDYMNVGRNAADDFHPDTVTGMQWSAVVGIVEQYTKDRAGYDYYQLLTRSSDDLIPLPVPALLLAAATPMLIRRRRSR